jgi:hypothetical protein
VKRIARAIVEGCRLVWLAEHRFDLDTALTLAREKAPHLKVNGWTVADELSGWKST